MIVTTAFEIEGYRVKETKGIVRGVVVRTPTITQGLRGAFRGILGGNIEAYAEMCEQTREHATDRLVRHAEEMGANAVIGVRYDASEVGAGATEVLCYGTAVVLEKRRED